MNYTQLSLDQAPPIAVPLRFFLTAPLFGVAAACLLPFAGPEALAGRWTPATLGLTHFLTLGFLAMAMFGAMLQLLPVLAGSSVPRPRMVSAVLHVLLTFGTLLLGVGLWQGRGALLQAAVPLLAAAFAGFVAAAGYGVHRSRSGHPTVRAMGLALAALAAAATLGLLLAAGHAWPSVPLARPWTDTHAAWALMGWVGMLVAGVAYQVVPMFQMTPDYPPFLTRILAPVLFTALAAWSVLALPGVSGAGSAGVVQLVPAVPVAAALVAFAVATLVLQARRRRKLPDVTLSYWRLGMVCLLASVALWLVGVLWQGPFPPALTVLVGVLYIVGFAVSVISGMLYKIIPFLVWLHLQRVLHSRGEWRGAIPNMKQIIPERAARRQYRVYGAALALLLAVILWPRPWTAYPASLALAAAWGMLWINLVRGVLLYRRLVDLRQSDGAERGA